MQSKIKSRSITNEAHSYLIVFEVYNKLFTPTLLIKLTNMEDFEIGAVDIDSELFGQDLDDIDPYAEFTDVEDEEYDDGGILYE